MVLLIFKEMESSLLEKQSFLDISGFLSKHHGSNIEDGLKRAYWDMLLTKIENGSIYPSINEASVKEL